MKPKTCLNCGAEIDKDAAELGYCPDCGDAFNENEGEIEELRDFEEVEDTGDDDSY